MNDKPVVLAQKQISPVPVPVAPKQGLTNVPVAPAPPPPPPTGNAQTLSRPPVVGDVPFNAFDLGVISGITVLVALVALIPKGLITRHLVSRRATPNAAGLAAWMGWFFIVVTAAVVLTGALEHLWTNLIFAVSGAAASLLLLVLTIVFFSRAQHTHR